MRVKQIPWVNCIHSSIFVFATHQPQLEMLVKRRIPLSHIKPSAKEKELAKDANPRWVFGDGQEEGGAR